MVKIERNNHWAFCWETVGIAGTRFNIRDLVIFGIKQLFFAIMVNQFGWLKGFLITVIAFRLQILIVAKYFGLVQLYSSDYLMMNDSEQNRLNIVGIMWMEQCKGQKIKD